MTTINLELTQDSLDALRRIRGQLYAIPGETVGAMSLDDQIRYGDSLQKIGTAILKLEAAKLKNVNEQFKARELDLRDATAELQKSAAELADAVHVIRAVSNGLSLVANIIALLA